MYMHVHACSYTHMHAHMHTHTPVETDEVRMVCVHVGKLNLYHQLQLKAEKHNLANLEFILI